MSAHTPGKWTVRHADDQEYPYPARLILGERGLLVAVARAAGGPDKNAAANARRIVAAVNAAEGISTETLESQGYAASYIATMAERDALKALNAELVAVVEAALDYCSSEAIGTVEQEIKDNERMRETFLAILDKARP